MNTIFKVDKDYLYNMQSYIIKDSCIALIFYVFVLISLYVVGRIYSISGKYHGELLSIITIAIVILLVRFRGDKVGISWKKFFPGIVAGVIMGIVFILSYTIIPGMVAGLTLLPAKMIAYNIFYYFVIIAFEEEVSFRGFIQPRLYPLFKKEWITLVVGGVLFVFMHYPFQMAARGMNFIEYFPLFIAGAPMQFIWHLVFSWFYRRFGNIYGGTVMHGFIDMSMGIFG